jgi:hypothetical protein
MKTQHEKNKEWLEEAIETYAGEQMTNSVAEHLSVYRGAYKALCMVEDWQGGGVAVLAAEVEEPARTIELDGDTEFERIIMELPSDQLHMVGAMSVLADHMESLKVINRRAYDNVIARLREVVGK